MNYQSLVQALNELQAKGYVFDFNVHSDGQSLLSRQDETEQYSLNQFKVNEVYRFEGPSDPADESVVYAIETKDGLKGVLVDGYGYSSSSISLELAQKLKIVTGGYK